MATQSHLPSALLKSARSYAGRLTALIKAKAPAHLQKGVKPTTAVEIEPGVIRITATVTGKDAHAQEYGSGLRSTYGTKEKYPIVPKPGTAFLEFQGTNAFDGWLIRTQKVMHPGIAPYSAKGNKGYMRPAIKEWMNKIRTSKTIPDAVRQAILADVRKSFETGWKK